MSTTKATETTPAQVFTWVKSATQHRFGAAATKSRSGRSCARSTCPPGSVVITRLPQTAPVMPSWRIRRSTVQRATRWPCWFSSRQIFLAPWTR
ncbi:hypothetical protein ADL01_10720 [Streptomyces sp. NRRL WC-3618]|nr:hypothetical protein [Streptomyces sp. NRRL WC-3618]KOV82193.1 hypothetical protein ADL01_10720 [Streptomyces sp. NRRL WC-3618]